MLTNKQLLANEYAKANSDYCSFNPDIYADASDAAASRVNPNAQMAVAAPFIVTLTNSTLSAIQDVKFLDASTAIAAGAAGNYGINASVSVDYEVAGVDYLAFLYSLLTTPALIAYTYIQSATAGQLLKTIKIETSDVRGKGAYDTFNPTLNPFQNLDMVITMPNKFIINARTSLTISSIAASTSVTFMFYPSLVGSTIAPLTGVAANNYQIPAISGVPQFLGIQ